MIANQRSEQLRKRRRAGRLGPIPRGRAGRRAGAGRLRRPRLKLLAIAAVALALLAGVWLWVRDSSLVAIHRVTVTGVSGPDGGQIRSALTSAARTMTTLDVSVAELRTAVAPYEVVRDLHVSTQFPHGLRIDVVEQTPVAEVTVGSRSIPVTGDGTLLRDVPASSSLPSIPLRVLPGGARLTDAQARQEVALPAAAPSQILAHLSQVTSESGHGLVAQIRNGPSIYFGDTTRLGEKWSAAIAVLADPGSAGASYIDVTDPRRPAAGAGGSSSSGAGAGGASAVGASGEAAGGAAAGASGAGASGEAAGGAAGSSGAETSGQTLSGAVAGSQGTPAGVAAGNQESSVGVTAGSQASPGTTSAEGG